MFSEYMLTHMLTSAWGAGFDMAPLIAFIAFAAMYMLAPVIGYSKERAKGMLTALYLLAAYGLVSLIPLITQWWTVSTGPPRISREDNLVHLVFVAAILKVLLFLAAMMSFLMGLTSLRLREQPRDVD